MRIAAFGSFAPRLLARVRAVAFAVAVVGCATAPVPSDEPSTEFDALLVREADPPPVRELEFRGEQAIWLARAPAVSASSFAAGEDIVGQEIDIGTGRRSVTCWLQPGGIDLGASTARLSKSLLDEAGVEQRSIQAVEAGAVGRHPYLGVRWLYVSVENGDRALGELHLLLASKGPAGVICIQDEVGFNGTFLHFFDELVSSLPAGPARGWVDPYYAEVVKMSMSGHDVGVQTLEFTRDVEGDTRSAAAVAMIVPVSSTELASTDGLDIEWSSESGDVINASYELLEGEGPPSWFRLDPHPDGGWQVSGVAQDKEIEAVIGDEQLVSDLGQARALRSLVAGGAVGETLRFAVWDASADPTRLLDARATLLERTDGGRARMSFELGPVTVEGAVDARGSLLEASMTVGPVQVEMRRIYQHGDF